MASMTALVEDGLVGIEATSDAIILTRWALSKEGRRATEVTHWVPSDREDAINFRKEIPGVSTDNAGFQLMSAQPIEAMVMKDDGPVVAGAKMWFERPLRARWRWVDHETYEQAGMNLDGVSLQTRVALLNAGLLDADQAASVVDEVRTKGI